MARPQIEFVHAQALPWRSGLYGGGRNDVEHRMLSFDDVTAESSVLIRYPAGWARRETEFMTVDEEFFVLDGAIEINGTVYEGMNYANLPANYERRAAASPKGAVVLTFFSGEPRCVSGTAPAGDCDRTRLVEYDPGLKGEFSRNFKNLGDAKSPGIAASAQRILREDPYDHEQTWLLCTNPLWRGGVVEIHPVVEEMYLVSGEMAADTGMMHAGAYFWRPAGIPHGPFGSLTGNIMFFRTKDGPLSTTYPAKDESFTWTPEHRPVLPPDLMQYGEKPWPKVQCF